jgi:hypothetical protein
MPRVDPDCDDYSRNNYVQEWAQKQETTDAQDCKQTHPNEDFTRLSDVASVLH